MRTRSSPRALLVTAALALVVAGPGGAPPPSLAAPDSPAGAAGRARAAADRSAAPVLAQAALIRSILNSGEVLSAVEASAIAAGHREALRDIPAPGAAPASLAQALSSIEGAIRRATEIVRASPAAHIRPRPSMAQILHMVFGAIHDPGRAPHVALDPSPAIRAAGILARAVDGAIPALRAAAAASPRPPRGAVAPGCDLVDQAPHLCVGGVGDNEFDGEYDVYIDLGGDDVYRNNAASASVARPVALVLDLSGNDLYDAPAGDPSAQGVGVFGGVGMVVDLLGNDTYRIVQTGSQVGGQGEGFFGGAGYFFDASGNDVHDIESTVAGADAGSAGQSEGFFAGVCSFVDGSGDDTYILKATALPKAGTDENGKPVTLYGVADSAGQGVGGFAGADVLSDGGGTDSFANIDRVMPTRPTAPLVLVTNDLLNPARPNAQVAGQGDSVLGGVTFFLEGTGNTSYVQSATLGPIPVAAQGPYATVIGQGQAPPDGTTTLVSDAGGDDVYSQTAVARSAVTFVAKDGCACDAPVGAVIGPTTIVGQGYGSVGQGTLQDGGGNDTHAASLATSTHLVVKDQRTARATPISGSAMTDSVVGQVQGVGLGGGQGLLHDAGGDDSYSVSSTASATAKGSSTVRANHPQLTASSSGVLTDAQGTGVGGAGTLQDEGGADTYSAFGKAVARVGGKATPGPVYLYVQGAADPAAGPGLGLAIDADGGLSHDTYVQSPPYPACTGTRGQGQWQDCHQVGLGSNDGG